jgi:hypothetical protein
MSLPNITLLSSTQGEVSVTGSAKRASGSSRSVGSLYTVVITSLNLQGRVYIEGTLAASPTEYDWFAIPMPDSDTPYIEFPEILGGNTSGAQNVGFNFKGNLVWVRARLDREHMDLDGLSEQALAAYGYIDQIVMNTGSWVSEDGLPASIVDGGVGVTSVRGNNLGTGERIYTSSVGQANVLLNFKTLVAGSNVSITSNANSITINSTTDGSGGGGDSGPVSFLDLTEAPSAFANGIVAGRNGDLEFLSAPTAANQSLRWNGSAYYWANPDAQSPTNLIIKDDGTVVTNTGGEINFGSGLAVQNVGGVPLVTVPVGSAATADREYVMLQYTAGSSGNLNSVDAIISQTSGVTVTIIDPVNCVVEFTFANRQFPPSSIALMGQAQQTNDFIFSNVNPSIGTRKIRGGGSAASPTLLGSFAGPITLQIRMSDVSASAAVGQRAKAVVMFRF